MRTNSFLEQLGIFFRPGFLQPSECRELIAAMGSSARVRAGLYDDSKKLHHDASVRQVGEVSGKVEGRGSLKERMQSLRPEIAKHFNVSVEKIEGPTLLEYKPGDFFLPHTDSGEGELVEGRKVTAVIYLNSPKSPSDEGYEGADLSLFGLMSFPGAENHGLPVEAATGLLVAFPAGLRHGVDKLVAGSRYCAVCWYR